MPFREHNNQQRRTQRNLVQPYHRRLGNVTLATKTGECSKSALCSWVLAFILSWGRGRLRLSAGHYSNLIAILKGPVIGKARLFQVDLENTVLEIICVPNPGSAISKGPPHERTARQNKRGPRETSSADQPFSAGCYKAPGNEQRQKQESAVNATLLT